jgi:adenine-specific DNA-methyltransferase
MKYELEDMDLHFSYPKPKDLIAYLLKIGNAPMYLDYFAGSGTTAHAVIEMNRDDAGSRKYTMVEMGEYFNTVIIPRLKKVVYSKDWKEGKPLSRDGISHCFKYIRLESYEDALNNLVFRDDDVREQALKKHDDFRREYMLKYWLDFETKGSPSLLSVEQFSDPTVYKLKIKKPGSDEYALKAVDLMETFNWLIGLHVDHIDAPRTFGGTFKREADPELPNDQATRLILDGKLTEDTNGKWWFRKVEGRVCRTPGDKTNMDKVLVIWRKLTGNLEEDNLMLDEWFSKYRLSTQDTEFDVIYVNGSNNLPNLKRDDEHWKVRLIEETFHQKMWDVEG